MRWSAERFDNSLQHKAIFSAATFVPFGGDQSLASFEHG
jgi:hypothetical protein